MKTFLIATDFSIASCNATRYGLALAKAFNGRVILVSAYQEIPIPVADSLAMVTPADMCEWVRQQLEAEADLLISERSTPVEIYAKEGTVSDAVLEAAKEM